MEDFLTAEDYELWIILNRGPLIPTKQNEQDNAKAKNILICGLGPNEYNRISACSNAKEIQDVLQTTHEGTNQVKRSRIELLMRYYELFSMEESEPIQEMMTKFTIIINKLKSLGKEPKATVIQEAKELDKISLDELIGNLKTHEMRNLELRKEKPKREKALVLKATEEDESENDNLDIAIFAKFKKFMKNSRNAPKRESNSKPKKADKSLYDGCYMCNKMDHIVKDYPMREIEWKKERA
ncbi:uncharacterized protein LOC142175909 [Nicotiana tabacum]|uniref:Uncharacterized protein LOC142175909 n=1 Tax=Nicotiana tabacum TaxID=4097 RepID=A0AC58TP64_TOBAC